MKVLVTGNMGYIGPVVVRYLREQHADIRIVGYDTGYFGHLLTNALSLPEAQLSSQHFGDVREFPAHLLEDVEAVVHLAAISNDPIGNKFAVATDAINHRSSVRIAELAKIHGVRNFVLASSCSIYGSAEGGPRREVDTPNPLTAYALSKVAAETELGLMDLGQMVVTSLRFSTACGMSDRLRLDLVLNDFVGCSLATGEITVLSDGSPWRPLIHVRDMARAIDWGITRKPENGGQYLRVNVGSDAWNYQVKDLARVVAALVPGTRVNINAASPPDKRSYRVDFSLFRALAPDYQPQVTLEQAVLGLEAGLRSMNFRDALFRESRFMRLKVLEELIREGRLDESLRWR